MKVVSSVRATVHLSGRRIDLRWKNPAATAFAPAAFVGVVVTRKERTFPESPSDGTVVLSGTVAGGTLRSEVSDRGLSPLTTYYYTLFTLDSAGGVHADGGTRVSAFATEGYDLAERLYRLLPAAHQRLDRPLRDDEILALPAAVREALSALPASLRSKGQLRRFLHALLSPLDLARSFAEGLPQVQDPAAARPEYLLPLASSLGWELDRTLPVHLQRNEVRDAPRTYRTVGTIPGIRSIVTRYARWYAQVAEMDERIARATCAPQLNVYSIALDGGVWRGADDAAPFLGFGADNDHAAGGGGPPATPAVLTGSVSAPFALRPGMELAVSTDGRPPARIRFAAGDFEDITQASAAEVAEVLGRLLPEIRCIAKGDELVLQTLALGPSASLEVQRLASSLVTLEGAPRGRIAALEGSLGRRRVFYQVNDPLRDASGGAAGAGKQIRHKVFRGGEWSPSLPFPTDGAAAGDPAVTVEPDGTVIAFWVEGPDTGLSKIRYRVGTEREPSAAVLAGRRAGPFPVRPGMRLLVNRGRRDMAGFELAALDFADPGSPTAAEVVAALNARLPGITASIAANGALRLTTSQVGGSARIEIDLQASTAAEALGFEEENHVATGDWGDEIDWKSAEDLSLAVSPAGSAAAPRVYADLHAMTDPDGNVRLFWACHAGTAWGVFAARRTGAAWTHEETLATAAGGDREPFGISAGPGSVHVFWSRRDGTGTLEDRWALRRRELSYSGLSDVWLPEPASPIFPAVAADRQPAALLAGGLIQLFFQSNRTGSTDVWSATFDPAAGQIVVPPPPDTAPMLMLGGAQADHVPAPLVLPDGRMGMLFRSDRGFDLARAATRHFEVPEGRVTSPAETPAPPAEPPSFRTKDSGTLRRFHGGTSVVVADSSRRERMRQWDDFVAYTPQGVMGEPLSDDDLYTPGTLGLFLSPLVSVDPLTPAMIERLREVLGRFLPADVRAPVILAPRVDVEYVLLPQGITEAYEDDHPDIDYYPVPADAAAAELPDWSFLLSSTPGHVSWDPGDPQSLFHRVFYEPPQ